MTQHLRDLLHDRDMAREIAAAGRATILARHTCSHRADELLEIDRELRSRPSAAAWRRRAHRAERPAELRLP